MRVFITSTPAELAPHRAAACEVVRELGFEPVLRPADDGGEPLAACARQVARADAVLALVGWRCGPVPEPEAGGDGVRPWAYWEVDHAWDQGKTVRALLAGDAGSPQLRDADPDAVAALDDFRATLDRLAVVFDDEDDSLQSFRNLVRRQVQACAATPGAQAPPAVRLRAWPPPELPPRPYPLLLPYSHPALLAGREDEIAELRRLLARTAPIIGLYAPSGSGKSSLLAGGLVPALRAEKRPVAFERHPAEAGIAARLLGDLLDEPNAADTSDARAFVDRLAAVYRAAGRAPILVLDQFEDLLGRPEARPARTAVGTLLAASVQRLPDLDGPPCRWILAYRHEFHGEVVRWLGDVLRDVRGETPEGGAPALPHDLAGPERFQPWPLPPVATPPPSSDDRAGDAARVFLEAIEKPLAIPEDTESARPRYPWRFAAGHAERLARVFGEARKDRPAAALVPELQVVLARLLEEAGESDDGEVRVVEVPEDVEALIGQALEEHLKRGLDLAFPAQNRDERIRRTRALLALRELADAHGRRGAGASAEVLAQAIGGEGRDVLECLATPQTRLVVHEEHAEGWCYVLSHDRMAEALVSLVDEGAYAELGVDAELLRLRRLVALQSQLFAAGDEEQATAVAAKDARGVEAHADVLLWGDERRCWWTACQKRRRSGRRRNRIRGVAAAVAVALVAGATGFLASRWVRQKTLLEQIPTVKAETAFATLAVLADEDLDAELLKQLGRRKEPFDVLERGLEGVEEDQRAAAALLVVELVMPLLLEEPEDPVRVGSAVWALDFAAAQDPKVAKRARDLRDRILEPLRQLRPPPPLVDADWSDIPAGQFDMGTGPDDPGDEDERPQHEVTVSAFRMLRHEVTNAEYRRLVPGHAAGEADDLPAAAVSWYEAYTYAAWLGGRLPTEAEWEYSARAGCEHPYCRQDGSPATVGEVAWTRESFRGPETRRFSAQPVMQLEPNPWRLYDMLGNLWEWTADGDGEYWEEAVSDPWAPSGGLRVFRGGSFWNVADGARVANRVRFSPDDALVYLGFRVVLPPRRPEP